MKTMTMTQDTQAFDKENNPNAKILTAALRYLGYNNNAAICDITDNAIDADADTIQVFVTEEKESKTIIIADNGSGMSMEVLDEALRLGSDVDHDSDSQLGKFGMGLCTASLSLCTRLEVYTKQKGSPLLKSIQDIAEIERQNKFVKFLGYANEQDEALFSTLLPNCEHGTVIMLKNCDNLKNPNIGQVKNQIKTELSRIFRVFIHNGRKIFVNNEPCHSLDPLMLDKSELYSDDYYDVEVTPRNGEQPISGKIRVRLVILPDYSIEENKRLKIGPATQGFYLLRNGREVKAASTLGLYTRHPSLNRFRGEVWFSAELDEAMGVNFTKKDLDINKSVFDKLQNNIMPQLKRIRELCRKKYIANQSEDVPHEDSAKLIGLKSPELIKPKPDRLPISKAKPKQEEQPAGPGDKEEQKDTKRKKMASHPCRFGVVHMGSGGQIYEAYMEGKTMVINWNVDHPFYERFVLLNKDNPTMITSTDFLVYSLASAELSVWDEQNQSIIESIKTIMSSNMRVLLT